MHLSGEKAIMALSPHSIELKKKQHKVNAYDPLGHAVYFLAGFEGYAVCAAPLCAFDTRQTVTAFAAERAIFGNERIVAAIAAHRDCAIVLTCSLAIGFFARIAFVLATAKFTAFLLEFGAFAVSIRGPGAERLDIRAFDRRHALLGIVAV